MQQAEIELHHAAGLAYGVDATCGTKVNYKSEDTAIRSAISMNAKREDDDKLLEGYPCPFCQGWHLGRKLTDEERAKFGATTK